MGPPNGGVLAAFRVGRNSWHGHKPFVGQRRYVMFNWLRSDAALTRLEVDGRGLDAMDRRYLACIAENYGGGPVGVDTLAAALSEQRDVIEDVIEPYLMQLGLLMRTPRGRLLSEGGYRHLGKTIPKGQKQQLDLLAGGQEDNQPDDQAGEA